ncbi:MAG: hypothetical protein DRJ05_14080 [Bacteroidetes bacterium]|nr:MAG: hypothetical protein DRJ05_14080 [Bacteroidota bacterium]
MLTLDLKKQLIDRINKNENRELLDEAIRLFDIESEDIDVFKLNIEQRDVVDEARQQIKNGQYLTNEKANSEIEEWLKK